MSGAAMLATMARNNAWANARLHEAVRALPEGGFDAPREGFFPSLRATLNHILMCDLYYTDAVEENGRGDAAYRDPVDYAGPAELAAAQAAQDRRLIAFCDGLEEADLAREVPTVRGAGVVPERIDALLMHLFQHQVHHRGQAHNMLSQAGVAPPQLDEFHLRYDRHPSAASFDR